MTLNKKILLEYRKQNPKKYVDKFGNADPELLEGIIGMTEPTEVELANGVRPKPIWKTYHLAEIRAMGEVKIYPDPHLGKPQEVIDYAPKKVEVAPAAEVAETIAKSPEVEVKPEVLANGFTQGEETAPIVTESTNTQQ